MLRFRKFQKIVLHFLVFIGFFLPEVFAQGKSESLPLASFLWNHRDPMRVGWDGNKLFVQLKPYPDEGEYRLAFRVLREDTLISASSRIFWNNLIKIIINI